MRVGRDRALLAIAAVSFRQPPNPGTQWLQLSKRLRLRPREAKTEKGSKEREQKPRERPSLAETQHLHHICSHLIFFYKMASLGATDRISKQVIRKLQVYRKNSPSAGF